VKNTNLFSSLFKSTLTLPKILDFTIIISSAIYQNNVIITCYRCGTTCVTGTSRKYKSSATPSRVTPIGRLARGPRWVYLRATVAGYRKRFYYSLPVLYIGRVIKSIILLSTVFGGLRWRSPDQKHHVQIETKVSDLRPDDRAQADQDLYDERAVLP